MSSVTSYKKAYTQYTIHRAAGHPEEGTVWNERSREKHDQLGLRCRHIFWPIISQCLGPPDDVSILFGIGSTLNYDAPQAKLLYLPFQSAVCSRPPSAFIYSDFYGQWPALFSITGARRPDNELWSAGRLGRSKILRGRRGREAKANIGNLGVGGTDSIHENECLFMQFCHQEVFSFHFQCVYCEFLNQIMRIG